MKDYCVAVDICNTLADINGLLDEKLKSHRKKGCYYHPGIRSKQFFIENLWIFSEVKPIEFSAEVLTLLAKDYDIVYLTARPKESEFITRRWLALNSYPSGKVIFKENKSEVAKRLKVSFTIDDAPLEIEGYNRLNIPVLVPAKDYNETYDNRFQWSDLLQVVKILQEKGVYLEDALTWLGGSMAF